MPSILLLVSPSCGACPSAKSKDGPPAQQIALAERCLALDPRYADCWQGKAEALDLRKYLGLLQTIASVCPLLGLLGTVFGMIEVFAEIMVQGTGNASALAGGISQALITTAAGLTVAIPALVMHRYFTGKIDAIVVELEQETIKLVDALHSEENPEATA